MEAVGAAAAVATIFQCFCGQCSSEESTLKQCCYMRKPQALLKTLEHKISLLTARETDISIMLHQEKIQWGRNPTAEVSLWRDNVKKMKDAFKEKTHESELCGCFPNYYQRLNLGSYVSRVMPEVDSLIKQGNSFGTVVLVNMFQGRGKVLPTSHALVGETAKYLSSRIWKCVTGDYALIIGVYGMGGVGKTSLVKEINNKLLKENIYFDEVIWVTASKDSNVEKLQKEIAKEIGMLLDVDDSSLRRSRTLFEALERRGRFLLIIDDMWESFFLEDIGIPTPTYINGCKLLITSRSLSVCRGMEATREIQVCVLSEEDAWDLFKQKIGEEAISCSDLGKEVARECGGLPLALITVGLALRNEKSENKWKTALGELRNSTENIDGMQNKVFARLRFSYDRLKNDATRACYQYCALYPEDQLIETDELIKYWVWEGLVIGPENHLEKMQMGEMILSEIKSASLLESVYQDGSSNEYVKMHDLFRDMIIALTRANSTFMVKSGLSLKDPPLENEWPPDLERVSLMRNDLRALSGIPTCPKLRTLLVQYNSISKGIDPKFFEHIQNLEVLDLSYTGIKRLPNLISNLESLRTLLLRSCWDLSCVPTLEKLTELRVLDIAFTSLDKKPDGMDMLVNLRYLDLSFTKGFEDLPNLLRHYKFLECLFIVGMSLHDGLHYFKYLDMCTKLVVFKVNFRKMKHFNKFINSGCGTSLENFSFLIGESIPSVQQSKNYIGFFGVDFSGTLLRIPEETLELEISHSSSIKYLPFSGLTYSQLECFKIRFCDKMEYLLPRGKKIPNLKVLEVEGLRNLSRLCESLRAGTFRSLKVLNVRSCNQLRTLLPFELVKCLQNLEEIRIEDCYNLQKIISTGEGNEEITILPNLKRVKLSFLQTLERINGGVMVCNSLSSLEVVECPNLKTLPFLVEIKEELVNSLKEIRGDRRWWETIRMNHGDAAGLLDPVFIEY